MNLQLLFSDLLTVSLVTAIIIAVIALLYATLCKKYKSKWICLIWIVLAVRLILPFNPEFISISNPVEIPELDRTPITVPKAIAEYQQRITPPTEPKANNINKLNSNNSSQIIQQEQPLNEDATSYSPSTENDISNESAAIETIWVDSTTLLCLAWILGALIAMIIRFIQIVQFKLFLRNNTTVSKCESIYKILDSVKLEFNLHKKIQVYDCVRIGSPMVTGVFKTKLLMPQMQYTEKELYAVLRHELSHIKLRHLEIKLLSLACEIVHWFNPFVYLMSKLLNRDLEFACDAKVLKITSNTYREEYSKAILSVAGKVKNPPILHLNINHDCVRK